MGKNTEMLKSIFKVLANNQKEIKNIIPNMYRKNIYQIDYNYLKENNINTLIFDIDNTLVPVDDIKVPKKLKKLFKNITKNFKICIMSNNTEKRVLPIAKTLNTQYIANSKKPQKQAYQKALKILNSKKENTAMIGDQMMSDIKGANQYGLYTILVDPLSNKHNIKTKTSRILQNIIEKHLSKKELFKPQNYYKGEIK